MVTRSLVVYRPDPRLLSKLLKRYNGAVFAVVVVLKDSDGKRLGPIIREFKNRLDAEERNALVVVSGE